MPVTVRIPTVLRKTTNREPLVEADGSNIIGVLRHIDEQYPGFYERMCNEDGRIRRFVNVYLNNEDIRYLDSEQSKVNDGDEIAIIPAIAGG